MDDKYESLDVASKKAAYQGISAVIASRIAMAMPGMGTYIKYNNKRHQSFHFRFMNELRINIYQRPCS